MKTAKSAISIAVILFISLIAGCTSPDSGKPAYIRIDTGREKYALGEQITFTLFLVNRQNRDLEFNFTSGHQWDLTIYDSTGKEVYDAAKHMMYIEALTSIRIKANSESQMGAFTWDQKDSDGEAVKSGIYTIRAKLAGYSEVKGERNITISI